MLQTDGKTKTSIIRSKLTLLDEPFIQKELLQKILAKFAPSYRISSLCDLNMIAPIKKGGDVYLNLLAREKANYYMIGATYFQDEMYMFGGLHIYNRYGYTTQLAERYTVYNTKFSGKKRIGAAKFIFVRERESFFYGIEKKLIKGQKVNFMSRERALIQLLQDTKGKPEFYEDIYHEIDMGIVDRQRILSLVKKYCSQNKQDLIINFLAGTKK